MIRAWRVCQAAHEQSAFNGEGARLYGGRWNFKGQAAIYTAESLSLAALEILAHADTDLLPNNFLRFAIDIPDVITVDTIAFDQLPENWREQFPPQLCQAIGGQWLKANQAAVLSVPSAIIPEERNYLLNPNHTDFKKIEIHSSKPFQFDSRLWG